MTPKTPPYPTLATAKKFPLFHSSGNLSLVEGYFGT
jgi:hypothetical protein